MTMRLAFSMAFQIGEADLGGSILSQPCLTLYFALRISMQRLSRFDAIIQASFARSALFISLAFLNPRPPTLFGKRSLSLALQEEHALLFLGLPPKPPSDGVKFVTNFVWKIESGHSVCRSGLSNRSDEGAPTSPGQAFTSPPHEFSFKFLSEVGEI